MRLANPRQCIETVNDINAWIANFWRAVRADPEAVAHWAHYPVSEVDLFARGNWLFYREEAQTFIENMRGDPEYYDLKVAGWWVWGQCAWIGSGWGPPAHNARQINRKRPHFGNAGIGINRSCDKQSRAEY